MSTLRPSNDFQRELIREARKYVKPSHIPDHLRDIHAWLTGALYVLKRYGSDPDTIQATLRAAAAARDTADEEGAARRSALRARDLARNSGKE